jgi:hypothetical protein
MAISTIKPNSLGGVPCFSAYANNAQSISSGVFTKLQINTELFDTTNNFDSTTNYRFQPTVAGYYLITGAWLASTSSGGVNSIVYKNGSAYQIAGAPFAAGGTSCPVVSVVFLNGSTDYVEFYVYQSQGSSYSTIASRPDLNYFQGTFVRGV